MTRATLDRLTLPGLDFAPAQRFNGVRLVPLLRTAPPGDLRLSLRGYDESVMVVNLGGRPQAPKAAYYAYVPHGLVVTWSNDGAPTAAYGANLRTRDGTTYGRVARVTHRMARREEPNRLRLLPLHLAMEGFLSLHFGGPDVAWTEYSRRALSHGLSPRVESAVGGRAIEGLEDALRRFEIHEGQVGVLVFVADALASAFVTSHPDDYRALHRSLLEDFYGELIYQYGLLGHTGHFATPLDAADATTLDDLAHALERMRTDWADFHRQMADALIDRPLETQHVYRCGPFQLQRFITDLDLKGENHIGEAITRRDGTIEYLKTYRLSAAQSRRAHLLRQLAEHQWNLEDAATALNLTRDALILRLKHAGFGYLLKDHILRQAQRPHR